MDTANLCRRLRPDRLRELTWALVSIPSPTGDATACTRAYAERLAALGLEVRLEAGADPDHPSAVARLRGGGGPTLQLDGHTDHVPLPHPPPELLDDRIVGRGAADMKGSLAIMAEVATVLLEAGETPPGDLLLTAHDLHEAPGGLGETLIDLCRRGIHGDAAIVCEAARDLLPLAGRGMAIFELTIRRDGELCHEQVGEPNPIDTATEVLGRLAARRAEMATRPEPLVGPETIFVGQVHGGTFYNQNPVEAFLNGTWRFSPRKEFAEVRGEVAALLAEVPLPASLRFDLNLFQVRPSYALAEAEPIVQAVRDAWQTVHGAALPLSAAPVVCDTPILVREAGIPTVSHGPRMHGAHGEPEWIGVGDMVRTAEVYLHALARYWELTA